MLILQEDLRVGQDQSDIRCNPFQLCKDTSSKLTVNSEIVVASIRQHEDYNDGPLEKSLVRVRSARELINDGALSYDKIAACHQAPFRACNK